MTTIRIAANVVIAADFDAPDDLRAGNFCLVGVQPEARDPDATEAVAPLVVGAGALLRSHTVIYAGTRIGARFQTGHHVLVRQGCRIGDDVSIGSGSIVEHSVVIGHRVRLHSSCLVPEFTLLEDDAWLGPGVIITNAPYPMSDEAKERLMGAIVERGAKLGAGAVVMPGVRIGAGALVGAGAVVTRDVPAHTVVQGNPARFTRRVAELRYPDGTPAYPRAPA